VKERGSHNGSGLERETSPFCGVDKITQA
jgi:hypothetical protein